MTIAEIDPGWQPAPPLPTVRLRSERSKERAAELEEMLLKNSVVEEDERRSCSIPLAFRRLWGAPRAAFVWALDNPDVSMHAIYDFLIDEIGYHVPTPLEINDHRNMQCECFHDPAAGPVRSRFDAIEEDLAELRAFVPMLARMASLFEQSGSN